MAATFCVPPSAPALAGVPLRPLKLLHYEPSTAKAVLLIPPCADGEFHLLLRKAAEIQGKLCYSPPIQICLAHINRHSRACSVTDHVYSLAGVELPLDIRPTKRRRTADYRPTDADVPPMQGIYPNHHNTAYLTGQVAIDAFVAVESPNPSSSAQARDSPVMPISMVGGVGFDAFITAESLPPPAVPTSMVGGVGFDAFITAESLPPWAAPTSMVSGVGFDAFLTAESLPPSSAEGHDSPVMPLSMVDGAGFDAFVTAESLPPAAVPTSMVGEVEFDAAWWHVDPSMPGAQRQNYNVQGIEAA